MHYAYPIRHYKRDDDSEKLELIKIANIYFLQRAHKTFDTYIYVKKVGVFTYFNELVNC